MLINTVCTKYLQNIQLLLSTAKFTITLVFSKMLLATDLGFCKKLRSSFVFQKKVCSSNVQHTLAFEQKIVKYVVFKLDQNAMQIGLNSHIFGYLRIDLYHRSYFKWARQKFENFF